MCRKVFTLCEEIIWKQVTKNAIKINTDRKSRGNLKLWDKDIPFENQDLYELLRLRLPKTLLHFYALKV
jgi:hypothetical protein